MRVCVIGNSHISALKRAWDDGGAAAHPAHRLTFFGAVRDKLLDLRASEGMLVPRREDVRDSLIFTSGGQDRIDPALFDVFLVFGLCREIHRLVENLDRPYSSAVLHQSLIDYWESRNLIKVIDRLAKVTDTRIFAAHSPLESRGRDAPLDRGKYPTFIRLSNELVFAEHGARLLPQPAGTIVNGRESAGRFSQNSERLDDGRTHRNLSHGDDDMFHMNATFGRLWLTDFFAMLESRP